MFHKITERNGQQPRQLGLGKAAPLCFAAFPSRLCGALAEQKPEKTGAVEPDEIRNCYYREEPGYIQGIQEIEKSILPVKEEFVMDDLEKLIERLMKHKRDHLPLPTAHAREGLAGGVLEAG